jgi:hypothetical protein
MDPITLAASITSFLAPYLAKAGAKLADEAIERLPSAVSTLWGAITKRFKAKPAAAEAADDLTAKPDDAESQVVFKSQLRKLLQDDPEFAQQIAGLFETAEASVKVDFQGSGAVATGGSVAAGQGGVAVNGNVSGSIVVGNQNTVSSGKPADSEKT